MNVTPSQKRQSLVAPNHPDNEHVALVNSQSTQQAGLKQAAPYKLSANELWPDQGLNRMLSKVESFDADDFDEVECLEMLFYLSSRRRDARCLAETAIKTYGSLAKVFQRPSSELHQLVNLDHAMTAMLAIAKSSMKHILSVKISDLQKISSYIALIDYLSLDLREAEQEILRVLYLDNKNKIIKNEEMARGTINTVPLYPKEIAKRALLYCASSIILAHNHLSDDPTPSTDDIRLTVKTKGALSLIDVVLHDHVIIARNDCFSMKNQSII